MAGMLVVIEVDLVDDMVGGMLVELEYKKVVNMVVSLSNMEIQIQNPKINRGSAKLCSRNIFWNGVEAWQVFCNFLSRSGILVNLEVSC